MNVNFSSVSSSYSSARTSQTQRTGPTDEEKAKMFASMDSDSDGSVSKSEFDSFKPSDTPSQFNVQRSTSQMAQGQGGPGGPGGPGGAGGPPPGGGKGGMGGAGGAGGAGQDPIQSLDSDSDGSVSSDEFGLDSASDEVKKLYSAIDSDSDGSLSTDEISSFREQMQTQMGPPPGGAQGSDSSSSSSSSSNSSSSSSSTQSSQRPDASEMIRMIAARYAEISGNSSSSSTATQSLSVTA